VFTAVDADRVVRRVAHHTVAVRADGNRTRVKELAESPLGQRCSGCSEYLKAFLYGVRDDDVVFERHRGPLGTNL